MAATRSHARSRPVRHLLGGRHLDRGVGRRNGPALVLVHGSIADHTTFEPFVAVLREHLTTFSMDRRGFGASSDTPTTRSSATSRTSPRSSTRSPHDGRAGRVWGHSYGANCAMGGAARTTTSIASCCTSRASACRTRPDRSTHRRRAGHGRPRRGHRRRARRHPRDDGGGDRRVPRQPAVAGASRRRADDPAGVPSRRGVGLRARQFAAITAPTLLLTGTDSVPVVIEATDRAMAAIPDAGSRARRACPLRPPDRSGDGRRDRPRVHRLVAVRRRARPMTVFG